MNWRKIFLPSDQDLAIDDAAKIVHGIMNKFNVEEQSDIIFEVRKVLIFERIKEIEVKEKELNALKVDLRKLQKEPC